MFQFLQQTQAIEVARVTLLHLILVAIALVGFSVVRRLTR